jgi:hypothetical protein
MNDPIQIERIYADSWKVFKLILLESFASDPQAFHHGKLQTRRNFLKKKQLAALSLYKQFGFVIVGQEMFT